MTVQATATLLKTYLDGYVPDKFDSIKLKNLIMKIREEFAKQKTLEEKNVLLVALGEVISQAKALNQPNISEAIEIFKKGISITQNWKDALLNITSPVDAKALKKHNIKLAFNVPDNVAGSVYSYEAPANIVTLNVNPSYQSISESIGLTSEAGLQSRLLGDAAFTRYTYDKKGNITGAVTGIGAGLSVDVDVDQNQKSSRAAYFAIKHLIRLMETYSDPDALQKDLPHLLAMTKAAIKAKTPWISEPVSISVIRSFLQHDGYYRIVGVNLGNCLIGYYEPQTKKYYDISDAETNGLSGTFNFPNHMSSNAFKKIKRTVPAGGVIIGMSPDVVKLLAADTITFYNIRPSPSKKEPKIGIGVNATSFKPTAFAQVFTDCTTAQECITTLKTKIKTTIQANQNNLSKVGGNQDYTLTALCLPANAALTPKKPWGKRIAYGLAIAAAAILGTALITTGIALTMTGIFSPLGFLAGLIGSTITLTAGQLLFANIALCVTAGVSVALTTGVLASSAIFSTDKIWRDCHKYDAIPVAHRVQSFTYINDLDDANNVISPSGNNNINDIDNFDDSDDNNTNPAGAYTINNLRNE